MSTRSNKPDLAGPLPAPTRSKRANSVGGKSQQLEIANHHEEGSSPSSPSAGSHGFGPPSFNLLGQYPSTPQNPGYSSPQQRRENQTLSERTCHPLEPIHGSPEGRSHRGAQSFITQRPRDTEISSEIDSQEGSRGICQGMESVESKSRTLSQSQRQREEAQQQLSRDERSLQQSTEVETTHLFRQNPNVSIQQHVNGRIMNALLDSIVVANENIQTLDLNSETNFKTLVNTIEINSQNIQTAVVEHINSMFNKPLTITSDVQTVIADKILDTMKKSDNTCAKLAQKVSQLTDDLSGNTDYLLRNIKQDVIIEQQNKNRDDFDAVRDLMIQQNIRINNSLEHMSNQITRQLEVIRNDIKNISMSIPPATTPGNPEKNSPPHMSNNTPQFNNPYMRNEAPPPPRNNNHRTPGTYGGSMAMDYATLNKLLPPIADWPKFSGEGDYDHVNFIKYIDHILVSYSATDEIAIARLPRLFEGVALDWFVTKQETVGQQSWSTWKELIKAQFGTRLWEKKVRRAFESDYFDPLKHKPHKWCLAQKKRIDCIYKNPTQLEINDKILNQCRGNLEHQIRCRITDMDTDLSELIGVMEEVIEMTGISRKFKESLNDRKDPTTRPEVVKDKESKPSDTPPRKTPVPECYNCGEKGHKSPNCPSPKKKIYNVNMEVENEEDTQSNFDLIPTEPEDHQYNTDTQESILGFHVIQADIGDDLVINSIHGDSNLPQKWDSSMNVGHISDAKMLTNKPEAGMSYTMGKTSYTTVLFNGREVSALLDVGAFCSCTSGTFLDSCYPTWREVMLPIPKAKFSSCNSAMKPLGVVTMPLVFPHSKGSLRLSVEFVVLQDALCEYLIIGNDTFCLYGIDIFQSKNRFYTIGGDWKKKFVICNVHVKIPDPASVNTVRVSKELEDFKIEYLDQYSVSDILDDKQKLDVLQVGA